jgi:twitching motility protein PilT
MHINEYLKVMVDSKASDIYFKVGSPPALRIDNKLHTLDGQFGLPTEKLTPSDTFDLAYSIMNEAQRDEFQKNHELDFAYVVPGLGRFRANIYRQRGSIGMVLRAIAFKVQSIEELGLPDVIRKLSELQRGLVLIAGPAGAGKSTTMAAMVDHINKIRKCHIITIEDPVEFLHRDRESIISQREVGSDTHSFSDALRHVVRQNPDVILIGELRDIETISASLSAAETGRLVIGTLHSPDAIQAIRRAVDLFPAELQQQVRTQLSFVLQAVFYQILLPSTSGEGSRVLAYEVIMATPGVANLIREAKIQQISTLIQAGGQYGMHTLNMSLLQLLKDGLITPDVALTNSPDPKELKRDMEKAGL